SIQHHALISGQHLYHYNPIVESFFAEAKAKESRSRSPDGTVFLSYLQHLSVKYGFLTEDLPAAPVARVLPECLDDLKAVGMACWNSTFKAKNLVEARVPRRGEAFDGAYRLPPPGPLASPSARQLAADLHGETQRIWLRPPEELVDLFAGRIAS